MTKMDLDQVANSREQLLFGLVTLTLLFFIFNSVYSPQVKKVELAKTQKSALQLEKDALIRFSTVTPVIQQNITLSHKKGIKVKILLNEMKPICLDVTCLLAQLTDQGLVGSLEVKDVNYQSPVKDKGFLKTDFKMHLLGDFLSILQYLERLDQFPALFNIEKIAVRIVEEQRPDLEAEIDGRFFQIDPRSSPEAPSVGGKAP